MYLKKIPFALVIFGVLGLSSASTLSSGEKEYFPKDILIPRLNSKTVNLPAPITLAPSAPASSSSIGNEEKIKVVIDPGHGGKDCGTIGVCFLLEKNLVLEIGRMLFVALNSDPRFDAVLTRDTDVYLTLTNRKRLAQLLDADLFVSIHANWGDRATADGPEVYFLNLKPSDEAALKVAIQENREIKSEDKHFDREPILEAIPKDLSETSSLKKSCDLAEGIFKELHQVLPGEFRGAKQAPFLVLDGLNRPAILIEVGFLSNPEDCYFLGTDYGKRIIAEAIAEGIRRFGFIIMEERQLKIPRPNPTLIITDHQHPSEGQ